MIKLKYTVFCSIISLCACTTSSVNDLEDNQEGDFKIYLTSPELTEIGETDNTRSYASGTSTNAFDFYYENNDSIGIFPQGGYQIPFVVSGVPDSGSMTGASINAGTWRTNPSSTYACYLPFNYDNKSGSAIPFSYAGQKQIGNNGSDHLGAYVTLVSDATQANADGNSFTFLMRDIGCYLRLKMTVPATASYRKAVFKRVDQTKLFTLRGTYDMFDSSNRITKESTSYSISMELVQPNGTEGFSVNQGEVLIANFRVSPFTMFAGTYQCDLYDTEGHIYSSTRDFTSDTQFVEGNYSGIAFSGSGSSTAWTQSSNTSTVSSITEINSALSEGSSEDVELVVTGILSGSTITIPSSLTTTEDASVTLSFENVPTGDSSNMLTINESTTSDQTSTSYSDVNIAIPEVGSGESIPSLTILLPHSTVTLSPQESAAQYNVVNSTTAENTLVIESGVVINTLHIYGGNVIIKEGAIIYNIFDHTNGKSSIVNWNNGGTTQGSVTAEGSGYTSGN